MQTETRKLWDKAGEVAGYERAEVLVELGGLLLGEGDPAAALGAVGAARDIYAEHDDWRAMALCDHNASVVASGEDDLDEAIRLHTQAVELSARAGDEGTAANCMAHLADLHREAGDRETALRLLLDAADALHANRIRCVEGDCRFMAAELLLELDEPVAAIDQLRQSRALNRSHGKALNVAGCDLRIARALARIGRADDALGRVDAARAVYRAAGEDDELSSCDEWTAEVLVTTGRLIDAIEYTSQALEHAQLSEDVASSANCLVLMSAVALGGLAEDDALDMAQQAIAAFDAVGDGAGMARATIAKARALRALRRPAQARKAMAEARRLLEGCGASPYDLAQLAAAEADLR